MSDSSKSTSSLSEISHLFLSTIRQKQGAAPRRTPPKPNCSVDLTPEEFNDVAAGADAVEPGPAPITAIIASHLPDQYRAVCSYASHLSQQHRRVGIIEVDANELRLSCFDGTTEQDEAELADSSVGSYFEPRHLAEAMEELNADIDQWLVLIKDPKLAESRSALRLIQNWLLLSTCDSDGIISAYRSVKGLSNLEHQKLTVALINPADAEQAKRVQKKIADVCGRFLNWPVQPGPVLRADERATPRVIMHWHPTHDKSTMSVGPHWQTIESFLSRANPAAPEISSEENEEILGQAPENPTVPPASDSLAIPRAEAAAAHESDHRILSLNASDANSVLDAVLRQNGADLVACPVPLPMCETARLVVSRDRRLVLLAVAGKGLVDLRAIGYAYRWVIENRQLIAMAVPQFAINSEPLPKLRLLIEHTDRDAEMLRPILQNQLVEIFPFRTLNWSGRLGLLLNAA